MPIDMPENVRKLLADNPDLLKTVADPKFIDAVNKEIRDKATGLAEWCVACGASASKAIPDFSEVEKQLTTDEIREMGRRLLSIKP